jgi:opacity protein-like surface antigen
MWEWGGATQLGLTYTLSSSWFFDFNYTYAKTPKNTVKYVSPFTNKITLANLTGTSYINPSQQFDVQTFNISINKSF